MMKKHTHVIDVPGVLEDQYETKPSACVHNRTHWYVNSTQVDQNQHLQHIHQNALEERSSPMFQFVKGVGRREGGMMLSLVHYKSPKINYF